MTFYYKNDGTLRKRDDGKGNYWTPFRGNTVMTPGGLAMVIREEHMGHGFSEIVSVRILSDGSADWYRVSDIEPFNLTTGKVIKLGKKPIKVKRSKTGSRAHRRKKPKKFFSKKAGRYVTREEFLSGFKKGSRFDILDVKGRLKPGVRAKVPVMV